VEGQYQAAYRLGIPICLPKHLVSVDLAVIQNWKKDGKNYSKLIVFESG